jgi:adenylate kinase
MEMARVKACGFRRAIQAKSGDIVGRGLAARGAPRTLLGMGYTSILLLGAPGAGKGTQGKMLAGIPGFCHSSSGDMFRALDERSEMGRTFQQYSSRGELVPDRFTIDLWKQYMKGMERAGSFKPASDILILDGIPRNVAQARMLEDTVDVAKVIYLRCTDMDKMVQRLKGRALKENRVDDADEGVIRNRLEVYAQATEPLLNFYPPEKLAHVEATLTPDEVFQEIRKIVMPIKAAFDRAQA